MPGWERGSWGYHADDGRAFCEHGTGDAFGPTFSTGDVVGCGVDWTGLDPAEAAENEGQGGAGAGEGARCFFTKNGEMIGYAFAGLTGSLYPSAGLRTPGEAVVANFGGEPFKFDIARFVRARQRRVLARIHATPIPPALRLPPRAPPATLLPLYAPVPGSAAAAEAGVRETVEELVAAYLAHRGYSRTAEAFARQRAEERGERVRGLLAGGGGGVEVEIGKWAGEGAEGVGTEDGAAVRGQIRALLLEGDAAGALARVEAAFPEVLVDDGTDGSGGVRFKLRVREFVEAYKAAMAGVAAAAAGPSDGPANPAAPDSDDDSPPSSPPAFALHPLLSLGRSLSLTHSKDPRPAVQHALHRAFSLLAYADPAAQSAELARLLGQGARERLAEEVNGAVLVARGWPGVAELEGVWRQASAVGACLGEGGWGGAGLVGVGDVVK